MWLPPLGHSANSRARSARSAVARGCSEGVATSEEDARYAIRRGIENALAAHQAGRLHEIAKGWRVAASFERQDPLLSLALTFWDSWADSAAHEWLYYDPIEAEDWPRMAATIL